MGDEEWRLNFPNAFVEILNRVHSDHCPILLHCDVAQQEAHQRPFIFLAAWADHPEYEEIVAMLGEMEMKISPKSL